MGMSCLNMAVGQLLIAEPHPAALCKAIVTLGRGTPFCLLNIAVLRVQAQGDVPPLNETGDMPLVSFGYRESSREQPGNWDQVPVHYPQ